MEHHQFKINVDLRGITNRAQLISQRTINFVALGLNSTESISTNNLELPDLTIQQHFHSAAFENEENLKSSWKRWVLLSGFRDIAEAVGAILEEVQRVLSFWKLVELQQQKGKLHGSDWNFIIEGRRKKFHQLNFPRKLDFLNTKYSFKLNEEIISQISSINAIRNCLAHRMGLVSSEDVNEDQKLILKFSTLEISVSENGEEVPIKLPYYAEKETQISVTSKPRQLQFGLRQFVNIETEDFSQVCCTLFCFAQNCSSELETYGKSKGINFQNAYS